jgi:hypothetical protein
MENLAQNLDLDLDLEFDSESEEISQQTLEIVQPLMQECNAESLSENFYTELDAWARQAMAANGFGDY